MNAPAPSLPAVGSPATYGIGSDCYAGKVLGVFNQGREIWVEVDRLGVKKFTFRPASSRRAGQAEYRERGRSTGYLVLGEAIDYRDPSF